MFFDEHPWPGRRISGAPLPAVPAAGKVSTQQLAAFPHGHLLVRIERTPPWNSVDS
jgi:hypothetical protein